MKLYNWDTDGFKNAYKKYYYTVSRAPENAVALATLKSCGKARCICAYVDELLTYSRIFFENDKTFETRANNLINQFNIPVGSTILVVGCAFGFLLEELSKKGMNVVGIDNSHYIQTKKNKESLFPIRNIDVLSNTFKNEIKRFTKIEEYDYIITEDVISSYDNVGGSYDKLFSNLESILDTTLPKSNIIHIVELNVGESFVSKTLNEWRLVNPIHSWVDGMGKL